MTLRLNALSAACALVASDVLTACGAGMGRAPYRTLSPAPVTSSTSPARLPAVTTTDTLLLLGVEYPDAGPIGAHYAGVQFPVRIGSIDLGEGMRRGLGTSSALRADAALRRAGYRVRQGAFEEPPSLHGARFALVGRVAQLSVRGDGTTGPRQYRAETQVAWEVFDLAAGGSVLGLRTYGRAGLPDSISGSVLHAVDSALVALLGDFRFRLAVARPATNMGDAPTASFGLEKASNDPGSLSLNPGSPGASDAREQLASGVVTLRSVDGFDETGVILSRNGLALTSLETVGGAATVWARFPSGVERPARVLRRSPDAGVALLQVPCPDSCTPVAWTTDAVEAGEPIVVMRAPAGFDPEPIVDEGEVRGRSGQRVGARFEARLDLPLHGGEPVARAHDGVVIGIAVRWRNAMIGLGLGEALRSVDLSPEPGSSSAPPGIRQRAGS